MKTLIAAMLIIATTATAGWNKATYAVVNKVQLDAAIASGAIQEHILVKKLKGYPYITLRTSVDGTEVLFESEKPGDIAYLRSRAQAEGIDYTEHTPAETLALMETPAWTSEEPIQ